MRSTKLFLFIILLLAAGSTFGQVGVGIGTTKPAGQLHIAGTNLLDTARGSIVMSRYWLDSTNARASAMYHLYKTAVNKDQLVLGVSGDGGVYTSPLLYSNAKLVIQADGNIGIGTTSPIYRLDVADRIRLQQGPAGPAGILLYQTTPAANVAFIGMLNDNSVGFYSPTSKNLVGLIMNTATHNVGIGTNTPGAKLEIAGGIKVADSINIGGQVRITGGSPAAGKVLTSDASGVASWSSPPGTHYIGESYGGGIVFYVYDNGQHGLIAATSDFFTDVPWNGGMGIPANTRARADGVGAGLKNTAIIIANQGPVGGNSFAATVCNEYSVTVNGVTYGDWYLPSKHELNLLYLQKSAVGGFADYYYWSSSETVPNSAWGQNFLDGNQLNFNYVNYLYHSYFVRAVRAF